MSEKQRQLRLGKKWSDDVILKMRNSAKLAHLKKSYGFQKGHKDMVPIEARKKAAIKISISNTGKKYPTVVEFQRKNLTGKFDEKAIHWKGDNIGYAQIHRWVANKLGKSNEYKCSCGKKARHWANKSQEYLRDLTDWLPLCVKCHSRYDKFCKIGYYN